MERKAYAENEEFILYKLTEEDKESYMKIIIDGSDHPEMYEDPIFAKFTFETAMQENRNQFLIYDISGELMGTIMVKEADSNTPEIGIDLLKSKRYQGVAGKVIKLLAYQFYNQETMEHFVMNVLDTNTASKRMIEKTGALYVGRAESFQERVMKNLNELILNADDDMLQKYEELKETVKQMKPQVVHQYKYEPEMFGR